MDKEEKRLDRLSELLHALPVDNMPMTLSELDGYVTGVLACPEMIPPAEWLPQVWGETGDAHFADQKAAEETIGAVMTHYNSVAQAMTRSFWIEPLYEVDPNTDEILWEPWVDGYTRAMGLRSDTWENLLDRADEETRSTMIFLMALQEICTGKSKFTEEEIDEIDLEAPDLIPNCVATILQQARPELASTVAANFPRHAAQGGPSARTERSLPMRIRPQIQAVLWAELKRPFALERRSLLFTEFDQAQMAGHDEFHGDW